MPFTRTPLSLLRLRGSALDVAYGLGRARRRALPRRLEYWNARLAEGYHGRRDTLRRLEAGFLREAREQCPATLEEIRALAAGAGLPFAELFRLNLTELAVFAEKCSDLILPMATPGGRRILIAHNEDWDPLRNDVFVLHARLPDQEYCVLAYDGYLPGLSAGANSWGLVHSVNYLRPRDFRLGLPRIFLTRRLVTERGIEACLDFIAAHRRAFGQAIHLAQGSRYLGLELTARHMARIAPRFPTAHTNHYLSRELRPFAPEATPASRRRLRTARRLLRESGPKAGDALSPAAARRLARQILGDRSNLPYALWREADSPWESSATLAAVLVGTDGADLEIHRNRPGRDSAIRIRLDRP